MNRLDLFILLFILIIGLNGFRKGLISSLGGLVGLLVGAIAASRFYSVVGGWLGNNSAANFFAFILILILVSKLIGLAFWVVGKIFQIITIVPFVQSFNRVFGLILGLCEGILATSLIIYFMNKFPINEYLSGQIKTSIIAPVLIAVSTIMLPLLPEAMKKLRGLI